MDEAEAERKRLIAKVAADAAELVANVRRERDLRQAAGEDVAWLNRVLHELEPVAEQIHDLDVFQAIRVVFERHGAGPYPADELATIANVTTQDTRRVLDQLVAEGLAERADRPQS